MLVIILLDDTHGTIVRVGLKHTRRFNALPLHELDAIEADIETQHLVNDYSAWFVNR